MTAISVEGSLQSFVNLKATQESDADFQATSAEILSRKTFSSTGTRESEEFSGSATKDFVKDEVSSTTQSLNAEKKDASNDNIIQCNTAHKRRATMNFIEHKRDELHSDDFNIGLPRERYHPRPSRSRSSRIVLDDIDYSVRPEKVAKVRKVKHKPERGIRDPNLDQRDELLCNPARSTRANLKRSRTVNDAQNLKAVVDMGFSPKRAKKALQEQDGNVIKAVDVLVNNSLNTRSGAKSVDTADQIRRSDHSDVENLHPHQSPADQASALEEAFLEHGHDQSPGIFSSTSKPNVSVEIPISEAACAKLIIHNDRKTLPNAASTQSRDLEAITQSAQTPTVMNGEGCSEVTYQPEKLVEHTDTTKKRKRTTTGQSGGTPMLETKSAHSAKRRSGSNQMIEKTVDSANVTPVQDQKTVDQRSLSKCDGIENQGTSGISDTAQIGALIGTQSSGTEHLKNMTPGSPGNVESHLRPSSHSPINKGKVPYRVGLSRRARIAPLLRVMKK
jgi:hypothetical protein